MPTPLYEKLEAAEQANADLRRQLREAQEERDEARLQRNILGGIKAISQHWMVRGRHLLTHQQKQTRVAVRQAAKFQSEAEAFKVANTVKRDALRLVQHKIEQTLAGQYPEGQALKAALFVVREALGAK